MEYTNYSIQTLIALVSFWLSYTELIDSRKTHKWKKFVIVFTILIFTLLSIILTVFSSNAQQNKIEILSNNISILSPRKISKEQRNELITNLSLNPGKIALVSKMFDEESKNFSTELIDIFNKAGWQVANYVNTTLANSFNGDYYIYSKEQFYPNASLVKESLENILHLKYSEEDIPSEWISGQFNEDTIYLIIDSQHK